MVVYSEDRVRRLGMVLWLVLAIGVLVAVLAVLTILAGGHRAAGVAALVVALVLLGSSGTTLRLLPGRGRPARSASIVTGVLCVVCGVLSGSVAAFVLIVVGLGMLLLALLPDVPEGAT